jgi:hypothetical protein
MLASRDNIKQNSVMIERCPTRSVESAEPGDLITEPNIPEACMRCIQRALEDSSAPKEIVDTYDAGLARAREYVGDTDSSVPEDDFDRWKVISLSTPQEGLARQAIDEYGFDLGLIYGQSYEQGSETQVVTVKFDCYEEAETTA